MHHLVDLLAGLLQALGSTPGRPTDEAGRRASRRAARRATTMLVVVGAGTIVAVLVLLGVQGALGR